MPHISQTWPQFQVFNRHAQNTPMMYEVLHTSWHTRWIEHHTHNMTFISLLFLNKLRSWNSTLYWNLPIAPQLHGFMILRVKSHSYILWFRADSIQDCDHCFCRKGNCISYNIWYSTENSYFYLHFAENFLFYGKKISTAYYCISAWAVTLQLPNWNVRLYKL